MSKRLSDTVTDVAKDFRNNVFALLAFFITVLLTNSARSRNIENIFTKGIIKLVLYFILGSILYMEFSIIESLNVYIKIEECTAGKVTEAYSLAEIEEKTGIKAGHFTDLRRGKRKIIHGYKILVME